MIASMRGRLIETSDHDCVIEVGGIGYRCQASGRCLMRMGAEGTEVAVLIETSIKDDKIILTAFTDKAVQNAYTLLQIVQGVGSKAALAILSAINPDELMLAIAAADKAMISRADGVGPKLAQRIINELADKVGDLRLGGDTSIATTGSLKPESKAIADAVSALVNLGYGRAEAHQAVTLAAASDRSTDLAVLLPAALRELGGGGG